MDTEKTNKLPEGVGKKIVEALRKNTETVQEPAVEETYTQEYNEPAINYDEATPEEFYWNNQIEGSEAAAQNEPEEIIFEEDAFAEQETYKQTANLEEENPVEEEIYQQEPLMYETYQEEPEEITFEEVETFTPQFKEEETISYEDYTVKESQPTIQYETPITTVPAVETPKNIELSDNVQTLMNLISQLPSSVTRQTGAHIIRQTIEALGISMNKVLKEAQLAQDTIGQAIRNDLNTIEEYRNDIKVLEKRAQNYKKRSDELEDIISLFILTEQN